MSENDPSLRMESLELKLMDLENTVQQLNDVIISQNKDIERLQLQQQELLSRSSGAALADALPGASDERPPHY